MEPGGPKAEQWPGWVALFHVEQGLQALQIQLLARDSERRVSPNGFDAPENWRLTASSEEALLQMRLARPTWWWHRHPGLWCVALGCRGNRTCPMTRWRLAGRLRRLTKLEALRRTALTRSRCKREAEVTVVCWCPAPPYAAMPRAVQLMDLRSIAVGA